MRQNIRFSQSIIFDPCLRGFDEVLTDKTLSLLYCRCKKSLGDATNWDEQTLFLLNLAKSHLISGALSGVFLGDELTASGRGNHPNVAMALGKYCS